MRFFLVSLRLRLKSRLASKTVWVFTLLLAVVVLLGSVFSTVSPSPVEFVAGVAYDSTNAFSSAIVHRLEQLEVATFVPLPDVDPETLPDYITSREFQVVYLLPDNLLDRFISGQLAGAVSSVVSPTTQESFFTDKWIFAVAAVEASPYISGDELSKTLQIPYEELEGSIQESFQWYGEHYSFVTADNRYAGGAAESPAENEPSPLWVRGTLGVLFLLLFLLVFALIPLGVRQRQEVELRLSSLQRQLFFLSEFLTTFLLILLLGLLPILGLIPAGLSLSQALFPLVSYSFFLASSSSFAAVLLSSATDSFESAGIFLFLLVVTLGGVFFDPFEISRWLGRFAFFFPTYYPLQWSLTGNSWYALPLFAGGLLCMIGGLIRSYQRPQRRQ